MADPQQNPTDPIQGIPESGGSSQGTPESIGSPDSSPHPQPEPESDELVVQAWRAQLQRRLNGGGAAVLIIEALVVLFVPRAIAQSGTGLTPWRLAAILSVVVFLIVVAGLQRRSWGPQAGLAVQVPVLATGLFTGVMWFLGGIFVLLWWYLSRIRAELLGSLPARPPKIDG